MVVVQKKKTMPDNKKKYIKLANYKENVKLDETPVGGLLGGAVEKDKKSKAKTRLINIAKQNKKFKDDKSFQEARDKELKAYREAVAKGIKEGMSEKASMVGKIKKINQKAMRQKDAAFKLKSGNKPSIAKFMGVDKSPAKKLPEVEGSKSKKIDFSKMTDKQVEQALVRQIKKGYNLNEAEADTLFQGRREVKRRIMRDILKERNKK